jgi:hypothetical protein
VAAAGGDAPRSLAGATLYGRDEGARPYTELALIVAGSCMVLLYAGSARCRSAVRGAGASFGIAAVPAVSALTANHVYADRELVLGAGPWAAGAAAAAGIALSCVAAARGSLHQDCSPACRCPGPGLGWGVLAGCLGMIALAVLETGPDDPSAAVYRHVALIAGVALAAAALPWMTTVLVRSRVEPDTALPDDEPAKVHASAPAPRYGYIPPVAVHAEPWNRYRPPAAPSGGGTPARAAARAPQRRYMYAAYEGAVVWDASDDALAAATLRQDDPVVVLGESGPFYRVCLAAGVEGRVARSALRW